VNGVFFPGNRMKTLPGATAVADELNAFFRESGGVWEWGRGVVERQWQRAGLQPGESVLVEDYLQAVWAKGVDKEALFDELRVSTRSRAECPHRSPPWLQGAMSTQEGHVETSSSRVGGS